MLVVFVGYFIVISGTVFTSRLLEVVHRLGLTTVPSVAGGRFSKGVFCLLFGERPRKNQSKLSGLCSSDPCSLRAPLRPRGAGRVWALRLAPCCWLPWHQGPGAGHKCSCDGASG